MCFNFSFLESVLNHLGEKIQYDCEIARGTYMGKVEEARIQKV